MAARCASVGACETAGETIKNDALANEAKSIAARFDVLVIWINPCPFRGEPLNQSEIRNVMDVKNRKAGIIFRFRLACKPIVWITDDGSLKPPLQLDHSLAAVFAGEQSDQCLRRVLKPVDDVLLDLELAGGDP